MVEEMNLCVNSNINHDSNNLVHIGAINSCVLSPFYVYNSDLRNNRISVIEEGAFEGAVNLREM